MKRCSSSRFFSFRSSSARCRAISRRCFFIGPELFLKFQVKKYPSLSPHFYLIVFFIKIN
ncbi:MAG: hypothetical protein D3910_03725 [Candidatus Electrothrix sp. ATG2]|nr:hypothetical protein [Candidatus Electrothrix sp. ATG2]